MTIKNVTFVSVWNGGFEVESNAKWNEETKEVFDIETSNIDADNDGDELESLEGQFIELNHDKRIPVTEEGEFQYQTER